MERFKVSLKKMMEIKRLELALLTKDEIMLYETLTTDENYCYLHSKNPYQIRNLNYIALSAFFNDKPVGLALATEISSLASLKSLYVDEKYRQMGIGTELMMALEKEFRLKGCIVISMTYESNIKHFKEFEKILQGCNWKTPIPFMNRYFYKGADFNPPWITKDYNFPKELIVFPWSQLTPPGRKELLRREEQWNFPAVISPFLDEEHLEYSNSFGIKKEDEIIGWVITHRLNKSTIRYSSLYIQPEYQFQGISIFLLIKAMKTQKELINEGHEATWALFDINLDQTEPIWQQFIKRRLAPYADKTILINRTYKVLN